MMKTVKIIPVAIMVACGVVPAEARAPRQPPLQSYAVLWTNSPFTTKPVVETGGREVVNPFEDWALGGVSQVDGRYLVVLFHRKEANRQLILDQADKEAEFAIAEVKQGDDYLKTEVVIASGGKRGSVTYDEKLLKGRQAAASKAAQVKAQQAKALAARAAAQKKAGQKPTGVKPGSSGARQPRMRVIPQPKK